MNPVVAMTQLSSDEVLILVVVEVDTYPRGVSSKVVSSGHFRSFNAGLATVSSRSLRVGPGPLMGTPKLQDTALVKRLCPGNCCLIQL